MLCNSVGFVRWLAPLLIFAKRWQILVFCQSLDFVSERSNAITDNRNLADDFKITSTPARHFSGRLFKRNTTLWSSYVLESPGKKIFIGGDSGYDIHFKKIGETFGPFDWAILENGQYNEKWKYIHTLPEEFGKVVNDLNAKNIFPVHSGKFALAQHAWNEPLEKVKQNSLGKNYRLCTPMIGEKLNLDDESQTFSEWWK